jgi:hypothetical protein
MNNKTIAVSYTVIGAAVAASYLFTKKLEWDIKRNTKKMAKDMEKLQNSVANLGK